jgi:hypothetical protein
VPKLTAIAAALVPAAFAATPSLADTFSATCGDQWRSLTVVVNENVADVAFGGDSGDTRSWHVNGVTSYRQGLTETHVLPLDAGGGTLMLTFRLDALAPWGSALVSLSNEEQFEVVPCYKLLGL